MSEATPDVTLIVPSKPEYVSVVRVAAGEAAAQAGLGDSAVPDVQLAVSEACAHVVRHTGTGSSYSVDFEYGQGELVVTVGQRGPAADPSVRQPGDDEQDAALDLILIHDLVNHMIVQEEGMISLTLRFVREDGRENENYGRP